MRALTTSFPSRKPRSSNGAWAPERARAGGLSFNDVELSFTSNVWIGLPSSSMSTRPILLVVIVTSSESSGSVVDFPVHDRQVRALDRWGLRYSQPSHAGFLN